MAPQDVPAEVADPLINRIIGLEASQFLDIGEVEAAPVTTGKGVFEPKPVKAAAS